MRSGYVGHKLLVAVVDSGAPSFHDSQMPLKAFIPASVRRPGGKGRLQETSAALRGKNGRSKSGRETRE